MYLYLYIKLRRKITKNNNNEKRLNYRLEKKRKNARKRILSLFKTIFSAITCLNSRSNELKSFENQSNSISVRTKKKKIVIVVDETCRAVVYVRIRGGMGFGEEGSGGWNNADRRTAYPVGRNRSTAAALTG